MANRQVRASINDWFININLTMEENSLRLLIRVITVPRFAITPKIESDIKNEVNYKSQNSARISCNARRRVH